MRTAVDSSVLLDVLLDDSLHAGSSESALRHAGQTGLVVCEIVIAEIVPVLAGASIQEFLSDWQIEFLPTSEASAILAGEMFQLYLERGGKRGRIVPDFLIAAHAQLQATGLLARDRGYYRDYFHKLNLQEPGSKK